MINRYFHEALDEGRYQKQYGEWTRIVLYRLTDALEHLHLMVGTIAAHMQHNHISPDRIRTYLQVPDQRHVEQFISRRVREHLAGLLGKDTDQEKAGVFDRVGRSIVQREGWISPEREDTLEAFLAALYSTYSYEPSALDDLPDDIRNIAVQAAALVPPAREDEDAAPGDQ
ncbi:hypothetical protein ACFTXV_26415 [Streptomyces harbinensis]